MADENKILDWDDEITEDGYESTETVVLPAGNYPFSVVKIEKDYHEASAGVPDCNMAKLTIRVDGGDLGVSIVTERLYVCKKFEWKASNFLRSVGRKKHGEPIRWSEITKSQGDIGRCAVTVEEYTTNKGERSKRNNITKYFDKEEKQAKKEFSAGDF